MRSVAGVCSRGDSADAARTRGGSDDGVRAGDRNVCRYRSAWRSARADDRQRHSGSVHRSGARQTVRCRTRCGLHAVVCDHLLVAAAPLRSAGRMSASVELRGVSKRYGNIVAADDVSLIVRAGEFLTLLGPSGCGKTTLLRIIAGFVAPDSGTVLIGDADVTAVSPNRRDVNQVFQSYALFPHLSVHDNIAFGLKMQRRSAAETG